MQPNILLDELDQRVSTIPAEDLFESANSYFGLLRQSGHSRDAQRRR
jgi:hypothetical protein